MAEPVLPPPPGPVPYGDPVAVKPVVPPAGAKPAEPVEVAEVIVLVFVVFAYVLRVLDQRFRLLGRLVLYWFALVFISLHFVARFLSVLLGCVPLRLLSFPSHVALLLVFVFRLVMSLRIFFFRVVVSQFALLYFLLSRVRGVRFSLFVAFSMCALYLHIFYVLFFPAVVRMFAPPRTSFARFRLVSYIK